MKNPNSILIFFIVLFLLFWNPISFYLFYSTTTVYGSAILKILFWGMPVIGIALILSLKKGKIFSPKFQNSIFAISFTSMLLSILVLVNLIIGYRNQRTIVTTVANKVVTIKTDKKEGMIFEPNSTAHYKTVEFDFKAKINSLGLRNKEVSIEKPKGTFRVLCFGDSFTFGWGVEVENCWPMKLEKYLKAQGYSDVEVINCGQGGTYTSYYKKYLAKAAPLLKPDLVLVGVLQLDDLAQLFEEDFSKKLTKEEEKKLKTELLKSGKDSSSVENKSIISKTSILCKGFIKASFDNIIKGLSQIKKKEEIQIKGTWEEGMTKRIAKFNTLEKMDFSTFPDTIQKLFKTGNLNPGLLEYYLDFADRNFVFNTPSHPATRLALEAMTKDIAEMNQICAENNSKMIFINVPINIFTGHKVLRTPADVLNPYFQNNNKIDSMYESVAVKNKIQYLQLTKQFIDLENKTKYFFPFDGHPNITGYEELANCIGKFLIGTKFQEK
jgi:lysophospholipase L1-like esterase